MTNVDAKEIEKFSKNAHQWWDPSGEFKPLHQINPLRLQFIQKHVDLKGLRVLDVGCGGGILTEGLARCGATVTGIDLSQASLDTARLHLHESHLQVDYFYTSVEAFVDQHPKGFDVVTCMEMLEHVPNYVSVMEAIARLAKPQGKIFCSTLNRTLKAFLLGIVGAEYILGLIPKGTHSYEKFIKPSELAAAARPLGLHLQDMTGINYNPLTQEYFLCEDTAINYLTYFHRK